MTVTETPGAAADVLPSFGDLRRRHDNQTLQLARQTLSEFVVAQASLTRQNVGFGWTIQRDAPCRYDVLCTTYDHSRATGEPLPISSENNDDSIYSSPEVNIRMRFWHDVNHVRPALTFELLDELELGLWHVGECTKAGFGEDTVVWQLLHADLIGQATVMAYARRFPINQRRFVEGCIADGYGPGVLSELWRTP